MDVLPLILADGRPGGPYVIRVDRESHFGGVGYLERDVWGSSITTLNLARVFDDWSEAEAYAERWTKSREERSISSRSKAWAIHLVPKKGQGHGSRRSTSTG